jgi:hypothetical protein
MNYGIKVNSTREQGLEIIRVPKWLPADYRRLAVYPLISFYQLLELSFFTCQGENIP